MISAIEALAVLEGEAALPMLEQLEKEDESLKVRQAAIDARPEIDRVGQSAPGEG